MIHTNSTIQQQLLICGLNRPTVAKTIFSKAPLQLFSEDPALTISKMISRYYYSHDDLMTIDVMKARLEDSLSRKEQQKVRNGESPMSDTELSNWYNYVDSLYETNQDTSDEMLSELNKYVKKNLSEAAIYDEVSKEPDNIEETLGKRLEDIKSINLMGNNDEFEDVTGNFAGRVEMYKKLFEKKIPTGFSNLDYVLKGGLAKKKIALIAALSGYGKTTMLTNLSSNMVREGYNVLHISLEEIDAEQMLRFDKIMSGMGGKDILKGLDDTNEGLRSVYNIYNRYEETKNLLYVAKMPGTCGLDDVNQMIVSANRKLKGDLVDVVVLDYPELMAGAHKTGNDSMDGEVIYQGLSKIAQENDVLLITGSQLGRGANNKEIMSFSDVEGSYRKQNICSFVATLNINEEERKEGYARLYLDKLRDRELVKDKFLYFTFNKENLRYGMEDDKQEAEHHQLVDDTYNNTKEEYREKQSKATSKRENIMTNFV